MINRRFAAALFLLILSAMAAAQSERQPAPAMRAVDRDQSYFEAVPCEKLTDVGAHSDAEKRWLEARKKTCLQRYKAFLPTPVKGR